MKESFLFFRKREKTGVILITAIVFINVIFCMVFVPKIVKERAKHETYRADTQKMLQIQETPNAEKETIEKEEITQNGITQNRIEETTEFQKVSSNDAKPSVKERKKTDGKNPLESKEMQTMKDTRSTEKKIGENDDVYCMQVVFFTLGIVLSVGVLIKMYTKK